MAVLLICVLEARSPCAAGSKTGCNVAQTGADESHRPSRFPSANSAPEKSPPRRSHSPSESVMVVEDLACCIAPSA